MNKRHIIYLLLVLVIAWFPAHAAFSQVAWTDADCYYNGTVVNGYASVSVGYEMGYYYDTSIALVMYDPNDNIVAAETNYTGGYSHAFDDVDFAPTTPGTYTIRVYVDVQIYYSDYCGWIDYWGFSHVYQEPVTAWDYYELQGSDPEYCWTYCCMQLLELLSRDVVATVNVTTADIASDQISINLLPNEASGQLVVKAIGTAPDSSPVNFQVASDNRSGGSSYTYSFRPTQLPVGQYSQVSAQWFVGTNPSSSKSVHCPRDL